MDPVSPKYRPNAPELVADLVRAYPLAWMVSHGADFAATPLPLRPVVNAAGGVETLLGHFARSNRQIDYLKAHPRALVLMLGPSGYVSPSGMRDRTQAPTWNYASVQFLVQVAFTEEEADLRAVLDDLITAMEAGRPGAWAASDMGDRYGRLARRIVAFRATVLEERAVFKLGQDERDDVYPDIINGLRNEGAAELIDWMSRLNRR
jgi:transcriptional regulator